MTWGVGVGSSSSGSRWVVLQEWDHSDDGNVTEVVATGLGSYTEILVVGRQVSSASSGTRGMDVSTDEGVSYHTTSGDYRAVTTAGIETNSSGVSGHLTNSALARSFAIKITGNLPGVPPLIVSLTCDQERLFVANELVINAVKIRDTGGGNMTGGTIKVLAR